MTDHGMKTNEKAWLFWIYKTAMPKPVTPLRQIFEYMQNIYCIHLIDIIQFSNLHL